MSLLSARLCCVLLLLSIPLSLAGSALLDTDASLKWAALALSLPCVVPAALVGLRHERAREVSLLTSAALFPAMGVGSLASLVCLLVGLGLPAPRPARLLADLLCALTGVCASWLLLLAAYAGGVTVWAMMLASLGCSAALFGTVTLLRRPDLQDLWVGLGGAALIMGVVCVMSGGADGWPMFWRACGLCLLLPGLLVMTVGATRGRVTPWA